MICNPALHNAGKLDIYEHPFKAHLSQHRTPQCIVHFCYYLEKFVLHTGGNCSLLCRLIGPTFLCIFVKENCGQSSVNSTQTVIDALYKRSKFSLFACGSWISYDHHFMVRSSRAFVFLKRLRLLRLENFPQILNTLVTWRKVIFPTIAVDVISCLENRTLFILSPLAYICMEIYLFTTDRIFFSPFTCDQIT